MSVHVTSGVTLLLLLAVDLVVVSGQGLVRQQVEAFKSGQLSGFVYSDSLLFQQGAASAIHCAVLCSLDDECRTFTFTTTDSLRRGECRGHSELMTSQSTRTTSEGTALYTMRQSSVTAWLNTPCNASATCGPENSTCYQGNCSCSPGYYYSVSSGLCVDFCDSGDLQHSFQQYPDARLVGSNDLGQSSGTPEDCQAACAQLPHCRTAEWQKNNLRCRLATQTALDRPGDWHPEDVKFDFFQRDCA